MFRFVAAIGLALFLASAGSFSARAQSAPEPGPVATPNVEAELVSALNALPASGGTVTVALRQNINPGWHTYWRNPGDSGEPTRLFWRLPEGFEVAPLQWAPPSRLPFGPLVNFGYEGEVLLLAELTVPEGLEPGQPVRMEARADWLVCEEICIPESVELALVLPVSADPAPHPVWSERIEEARASHPQASPFPAGFERGADSLRIWVDAPALAPAFDEGRFLGAAFFPFEDGFLVNAKPQPVLYGPAGFQLDLAPGYRLRADKPSPERLEGVLVLNERLDDGEGVRSFIIAAAEGAAPAGTDTHRLEPPAPAFGFGLAAALGLALLGGIVLNLMPCVFPVLALKVMAFVRHGQAARAERLRHGLLYTSGILVTFLAIGGALLGLRAAGAEIGWGFQLQEPLVVSALALLLFAVAMNLAGFFEVGGSFQGLGQSLVAGRGGLSSFATGALAVVVAAPCTAPFMAPALGFALTQPAIAALGIFGALGLGLAAPFLLLSVVPGAGKWLPKPGAWMTRLKEFLAFPMFATAVWLVWVLAQQAGPMTLAAVLAAFVLMGFAVWLYRRLSGRVLGPAAALTALAMALALPVLAPREAPVPSGTGDAVAFAETNPDEDEGGGLPYEPYSEARLEEARAAGRPVFVNFTAAWCISCIVNERVTLRSADVLETFAAHNVLALKGDWTNRDPVITRALRRFDRSGVPLYVLYPAAGAEDAEPRVLPAVLTPALVKKAVEVVSDGLTPVASIR